MSGALNPDLLRKATRAMCRVLYGEHFDLHDEGAQDPESRDNLEDAAKAAIRAYTEAPGVVVTQLPKPDGRVRLDPERDVAGWDLDVNVPIEVRVDIYRRITLDGMEYTAEEIRALLPVLAAAAVLSEGEDNHA